MTSPSARMVLASASERRKVILERMGLTFDVIVPQVEEVLYPSDAQATVRENARRKGEWCADRVPAVAIIAADTAIGMDGVTIGKPSSLGDAALCLKRFSGREHHVYTGVAMRAARGSVHVEVVVSTVRFRTLDDATVQRYISLVDPLDKAGAYDINQHGSLIVESFAGSWTNIMGLPAETVWRWIETTALTVGDGGE